MIRVDKAVIALILLPWLAAAAADPPAEAPAEDGFSIIMDMATDPANCHAGNARRISFRKLAGKRPPPSGECVSVSGYLSGPALYASRPEAGIDRPHLAKELKGRRIGLYGLSRASPESWPRDGFYRVVGRTGDCAPLYIATMIMGYCHSTDGPYIAVSQIRRGR